MGILKDFPLRFIIFYLLFLLIWLAVCLKIYRMPQIVHAFQYVHHNGTRPLTGILWDIVTDSITFFQCVCTRYQYLSFRQNVCDSSRSVPVHTQAEDFSDCGCMGVSLSDRTGHGREKWRISSYGRWQGIARLQSKVMAYQSIGSLSVKSIWPLYEIFKEQLKRKECLFVHTQHSTTD